MWRAEPSAETVVQLDARSVVTLDPIGFAGGDANLYGFEGANTLNRIDPTGFDYISPLPSNDNQSLRLIPPPSVSPCMAGPPGGWVMHWILQPLLQSRPLSTNLKIIQG